MAKLSRTERRKKELRRRILQVLLLLLFMACVLVFAVGGVISGRQKKAEEKKKKEAEIAAEEEDLSRKRQIIEEADFLAEGYDYDAAYSSTMFQNANLSVRLTDDFMQAVVDEAGERIAADAGEHFGYMPAKNSNFTAAGFVSSDEYSGAYQEAVHKVLTKAVHP